MYIIYKLVEIFINILIFILSLLSALKMAWITSHCYDKLDTRIYFFIVIVLDPFIDN